MDARRVNPSDTDGFSSNAIDEATLLSEDVDGVPTGNLFTSKHPGGSLRSVFVVTNRSKDVDGCLNSRPHKNGSIRYILIWVFVPNLRLLPRGGKLEESPPDDDPNPCRHVHIISWKVYDSEQLFYQAIQDVMTRTGSNQIRMLIPGFRSTANKYARITGKMARDMDFVGPILLYSWGAGKNFEYFDAQESWLKPSILPLVQILWDVKEFLPNAKVGMIGHSLGSRLLTNGLTSYIEDITGSRADEIADEDVYKLRESLTNISHIVLAAADQSVEEFLGLCCLLLNIRDDVLLTDSAFVLPTLTVYCSRDDCPLVVSKVLHLERRLGRTRGCQSSIEQNKLNLNDGMYDFVDIVDTTGLFESKGNHSLYYRSSRVLNDMKKVFNGERACRRNSIHSGIVLPNGTIYAFNREGLQASRLRVAWDSSCHFFKSLTRGV